MAQTPLPDKTHSPQQAASQAYALAALRQYRKRLPRRETLERQRQKADQLLLLWADPEARTATEAERLRDFVQRATLHRREFYPAAMIAQADRATLASLLEATIADSALEVSILDEPMPPQLPVAMPAALALDQRAAITARPRTTAGPPGNEKGRRHPCRGAAADFRKPLPLKISEPRAIARAFLGSGWRRGAP